MRDYTKIAAWKAADDLAVAVYLSSKGFPKDEVYAITSQIRRAAYSVPANIAEGSARESRKDYLHFLFIARGSLTEVQYFIHLTHRLGYLSDEKYDRLEEQVKATFVRLHGLIKAVQNELQ